MAILKQRLHRKNASGSYDTVHLETSADLVLMPDGTKLSNKISSMDTTIAGKASASHSHAAQTSVTGNAGTATKLATARSIQTNLASTSAVNFDGSANITPGVTGTLPVTNGGTGVTSIAALKTALGIGTGGTSGVIGNADYSNIISGSIGLGTVVTMGGYQWVVVHFDTAQHIFYMMTTNTMGTDVPMTTATRCTSYGASTLHTSVAQTFENNLPAAVRNRLATVSISGTTAKVFAPSRDQVNGEFSYMDSDAKRMAMNNSGYWTSTFSKYDSTDGVDWFWRVNEKGVINQGSAKQTLYYEFRPCVALAM